MIGPSNAVALRVRVLTLFLGLWSFGFGCVHVAWALGSRWGVPAGADPISERPWFLAYDVAAGLLMYAAAGVCVAFHLGRETLALRRATAVGSALALLRGAPAAMIDLVSGDVGGLGFAADLWFTIAGLAGLELLRASRGAGGG